MLRLPPFTYRAAASVADAAAILAGEGAAEGRPVRLVAGGTDLWPNLKRRHQEASTVVGIGRLAELRGIHANGELRLGAATVLTDIERAAAVRERWPALARAVASISSPVLRNMGTIGGNLCLDTRCTYYNQTEEWRRSIDYCLKAVGTVCWVAPGSLRCWAISASDSAPMLVALGAEVRLVSTAGERVLPLHALYRDDGIDYLGKRPDEILVDVSVPARSAAPACRSAFWKLRRRGSIDFAVLSAAVALWLDAGGAVERARIVLGAVGSAPIDAAAAAASLIGAPPAPERLAAAARLARAAATPMDNTDFHTAWRGVMVEKYVEAALCEAAGLPLERLPPRHP